MNSRLVSAATLLALAALAATVWLRRGLSRPVFETDPEVVPSRGFVAGRPDPAEAMPGVAYGATQQVRGADPFSAAMVVETRMVADSHGNPIERWRLVELPQDPGRMARIVDRLQIDEATGQWTIAEQFAMAPDSVVVGVPEGTDPAEMARQLRELGFSTREVRGSDPAVTVELPDGRLESVPEALALIAAAVPGVVAEPNFLHFPFQTTPTDFNPDILWGLVNTEAPAAWTVSTGSPEVVVAVIDTGVDRTHPDLAANIWRNPGEVAGNGRDDDGNGFVDDLSGWDFAGGNADPSDQDDHGTHVAGTIGAVGGNGIGVAGVNWSVRIMALRVGDRTFENSRTLSALGYVNALKQRGINVVAVNASFGGGAFSTLFRNALITARDNGVLFIAAAGNDSSNNDTSAVYPSSYSVENVIAVASIHPGNALSGFSNYGRTRVHLAAPGTGIHSTVRNGGYNFFNGTSMAAPHVTGAAALITAVNPGLAWHEIRDRILGGVDQVPALANRVSSGGKLNIRRAVAPALVPPKVEIMSPSVGTVLMDRTGVPLTLVAELVAEEGRSSAAEVRWEQVEGPTGVSFADARARSTSVTLSTPGRYWLRVRAEAGVLGDAADLFVAVGEEGLEASTDGLQGWWRFDETGGTAIDSSGNGRNGSLVGTPRRITGVQDGGLEFDGSSGRVVFSSPSLTRLTLTGWAFPAATSGVSIFPRVVHLREGLLFLGRDSSATADDGNRGTLKFARDDGLSTRVWFAPPGTSGGGSWVHLAATFDASAGADATPRLYYDGQPQVVGVQTSPATTPSVAIGTGVIGDRGDGGRVWNGGLDEIRIYSRELSAGELAIMAATPRMRAIGAGRVTAEPSGEAGGFVVGWLPANGTPAAAQISQPAWSVVDSDLTGGIGGTTDATINVPGPGTWILRLDMVVDGKIHVVRTIPVTADADPFSVRGRYSGATAEGGGFFVEADSSGRATFVGSNGGGLFGTGFQVSGYGWFSFETRSGQSVSGRIDASGGIEGFLGDAGVFSGTRLDAGLSKTAIDGLYDGWVIAAGIRAAAQVSAGIVAIVLEESGVGRAAIGPVNGNGRFDLASPDGGRFAGTVSDGRVAVVIAVPGREPREALLFRDAERTAGRLVNLSARSVAGTGDATMIAGFVVDGSPLPVLVRGTGPGLQEFGVTDFLTDPELGLRREQTLLATNGGWDLSENAGVIEAAAARLGAFALEPGSRDAALLWSAESGAYTASVSAASGSPGTALVEIYDARESEQSGALLRNLSARAPVGGGDGILIGGFVVEGDAPCLVLVRAAGPALGAQGVAGFLPLTELSIWRGETRVASSEGWSEGEGADLVAQAAASVGAFAFDADSADAALLAYLPPGEYTAQVRGRDGVTGIALVEIYRVDGF